MTLFGDFVTGQTLTFARVRALLAESGGGLQEGVIGATDLKVSQRGAGANMSVDVAAGAAWVAVDSGTRNGLAHVFNDVVANVAVAASHATLPRVDQVTLRYNDSSIPTGSGNTPTFEVLTGTATAGAQTNNFAGANYRAGAAALGNDRLLLGDILVRAASSSIITTDIVDRRPWARGAYAYKTAGGAGDYTTTSTAYAAIDTTNLQQRIECSGAPLLITFSGNAVTTAGLVRISVGVDFVVQDATNVAEIGVTSVVPFSLNQLVTPAAGSHLITPYWAQSVAGTATMQRSTGTGVTSVPALLIQEIVRPNNNNGVA